MENDALSSNEEVTEEDWEYMPDLGMLESLPFDNPDLTSLESWKDFVSSVNERDEEIEAAMEKIDEIEDQIIEKENSLPETPKSVHSRRTSIIANSRRSSISQPPPPDPELINLEENENTPKMTLIKEEPALNFELELIPMEISLEETTRIQELEKMHTQEEKILEDLNDELAKINEQLIEQTSAEAINEIEIVQDAPLTVYTFEKTSQVEVKPAEVFQERVVFAKNKEPEPEVILVSPEQWSEYLETNQRLSMQERNITMEINILFSKEAQEKEKQQKFIYKIDGLRSMETIWIRQLRSLKTKRQQMQEKVKSMTLWFKTEAAGSYEREKEKSGILIAKAAKITEQRRQMFSNLQEESCHLSRKQRSSQSLLSQNKEKLAELQEIHQNLVKENSKINAEIGQLTNDLKEKNAAREHIIKTKLQNEEQQRQFEFNLLLEACNKEGDNGPIDMFDLKNFNIKAMDLEKLPDLSPVLNLKFVNMDENKFTNLDGLSVLQELNFLSFNSNQVSKFDMENFKALKHLEAANNNVTQITVRPVFTVGYKQLQKLTLDGYFVQSYTFPRFFKGIHYVTCFAYESGKSTKFRFHFCFKVSFGVGFRS